MLHALATHGYHGDLCRCLRQRMKAASDDKEPLVTPGEQPAVWPYETDQLERHPGVIVCVQESGGKSVLDVFV